MSRRPARSRRAAPRPDLTASLVVIMPLVLAYSLGVLATGALNVVDVPTRLLWRACHRDRDVYLLVHAGLALGYLAWLALRGRRGLLTARVLGPLVLEAAVVALALLALLELVAGGSPRLGALAGAVSALGAGLHEELVFRALGLLGGAWLLRRAGVPTTAAWWLALAAQAVLFAAAHHWAGEPWATRAFVARAVAGVVFGLVAWRRSLAHAVYAHTTYDLLLLALR